jgi:cytochrome c1
MRCVAASPPAIPADDRVEYDRTAVRDLVNYLVYMGEPRRKREKQHRHVRAVLPGVLFVLCLRWLKKPTGRTC